MRTLAGLVAAGFLLLGCSRATPAGPAAPATPAPAPMVEPVVPSAAPVRVVYTHAASYGRKVVSVSEDLSSPAVALSADGVDSRFVVALAGGRALLVELAGGALTRFVAVSGDGQRRAPLGSLPAGRYQATGAVRLLGEAVAIEAVRAGATTRDVLSLSTAGAPVLLARDASLVAAAAGRVAWLQAGNLSSARLDGGAPLALGDGDGLDEVAGVSGDRVLVTVHGPGRGDVRVIGLDGTRRQDAGTAGADERAFAFAGPRAIFTRTTDAGAALVALPLDGSGERTLTPAALDLTPRLATDAGLVLAESAAGALLAVDAATASVRTLDPAAGNDLVVATVTDGRVVYTGVGALAPSLRAARLDGGGVAVLCERPLWLPFFAALTPDGRVIFHRALAAQLEGGRAYSVRLDGSDLRPLGADVLLDGPIAIAPADQDFEAVTPAGRVLLEAEFEGLADPQLLLASPASPVTRTVGSHPSLRFAGLLAN